MVLELLDALPEEQVNGRQTYHQHHGVPGGDATVMLVPASPTWDEGEARSTHPDQPDDVRPPLDVLAAWSIRWRASCGAPAQPVTIEGVTDHLAGQLHLIAASTMFLPFARDLGSLLHQMENVLHAGDRPDVSRVPCLSCGTRLQKQWADQADHDYWRCPVCGDRYDHGRYQRAQYDQLASRGADRFVPLMDAVAVTGRSEETVRSWVREGLVDSRREPGRPREVWWPDVRDRHRVTPVRSRGRA
jgi:hypothetical protein